MSDPYTVANMLLLVLSIVCVVLLHRNNLALRWTLLGSREWFDTSNEYLLSLDISLPQGEFHALLEKSDKFHELYDEKFPSQIGLIVEVTHWSYESATLEYHKEFEALKAELFGGLK